MREHQIALLPGDGIGPEITRVTKRLLEKVSQVYNFNLNFQELPIGGQAIELLDNPLPNSTLETCKKCDCVLLAAIGSPKYDELSRDKRPETGLLRLREGLELYANIRPVKTWTALADASPLKKDLIKGVDLIVVRELTGGIYFGKPKGRINTEGGERAFNTMTYSNTEIDRIAKVAFKLAQTRGKKICSVDKANVLEVSQLWRERVEVLASMHPSIKVNHLYVDNAAMQLIKEPSQFDLILTGNLFGDILSDAAAMLTGSIGMLPSASLGDESKGLFEPVHGSAPDIAGKDLANPMAMILSAAMMLRISLKEKEAAEAIETAVEKTLCEGFRTQDLLSKGCIKVTCSEIGEKILDFI